MFTSYLKATLRSINRERFYALINFSGLSLGMACSILLGLYVDSQFRYNTHFDNHERIYRVTNDYSIQGSETRSALTSHTLGPLLKMIEPERIDAYTRFRIPNITGSTGFRSEADMYYWDNVFIADPNVFQFFGHEIIYGDPDQALDDPSSLAVSESFARAYFGDENPIGKFLRTDLSQYQITLVFADMPSNTHLKYDALLSMRLFGDTPGSPAELKGMLFSFSTYTYVRTPAEVVPEAVSNMFDDFKDEHINPLIETASEGVSIDLRYRAQNLSDIYLESGLDSDQPTANILHLYGYSALAFFLLIVACFNYINLSTARSMRRSREVGIRKILGAERRHLIWQLLGESAFFVFISLIVALTVVNIITDLDLLDSRLGEEILLRDIFEFGFLGLMVILGLLVTLVSGLYPATYFSSANPLSALSNSLSSSKTQSGRLRQLLILLQFTLSIGIVASILLMSNQMQFISEKPLGYNKEHKMLVPLRGAELLQQESQLIETLDTNPLILGATTTNNIPGTLASLEVFRFETEVGAVEPRNVRGLNVGRNFLDTMQIQLKVGRDFPQTITANSSAPVIVNETLVDSLGWSQAIGKRIENRAGEIIGEVIGVVEDFNQNSLYNPVSPLMIRRVTMDYENLPATESVLITRTLIVDFSEERTAEAIEFVRGVMTEFDPDHPFEFEFLASRLDQLYQSEGSAIDLAVLFSVICIFISCLGLFGLSSFTTERRTKEMGIRKILGASTAQVLALLLRNITFLILISSAIASFVSYLVITQWLGNFAFREAINPLIFLLSTAAILAVAIGSTVLQSLRAARANPVNTLRHE